MNLQIPSRKACLGGGVAAILITLGLLSYNNYGQLKPSPQRTKIARNIDNINHKETITRTNTDRSKYHISHTHVLSEHDGKIEYNGRDVGKGDLQLRSAENGTSDWTNYVKKDLKNKIGDIQTKVFREKNEGNKTESNNRAASDSDQGKDNDKYRRDDGGHEVFEDYSSSTEESTSLPTTVESTSLPTTVESTSPATTVESTSPATTVSNSSHSHDNTSITLAVAKRFADRGRRIHEICQKSQYQNAQSKRRLKNVVSKLANGRLTWCQVPKVGTTFLKYLRKSVDTLENVAKKKRGSKKVSPEQTRRFFLVREPYSRLVSGYICKIVLTASFWLQYGAPIVKKFRTEPREASVKCGNDVTFPEFIKYFIYSQENSWHRNLHFVPIHEQCGVCKTQYDYVGHLETFKDDFGFMLRSVNLLVDFDMNHDEREIKGKARGVFKNQKIRDMCEPKCITLRKAWWSFHVRGFVAKQIEFPLSKNCSTISSEEFAEISWSAHLRSVGSFDKSKQKREAMVQLYRQVPLSDRLRVRDILKTDFDMFGYDPQPADLFPEMVEDN